MGNSLQDQLLKMGLVDKKQAGATKKARHDQKIKHGRQGTAEAETPLARAAMAEKKARSRQLNEVKNEEAKEREMGARIRQRIASQRLALEGGDIPYNFTDDNKIKRILLPKQSIDMLSRGELAIVRQAGEYHLVPAEVAREVRAFNPNQIVVYHPPAADTPSAPDDPYAEYQIPDDLMW